MYMHMYVDMHLCKHIHMCMHVHEHKYPIFLLWPMRLQLNTCIHACMHAYTLLSHTYVYIWWHAHTATTWCAQKHRIHTYMHTCTWHVQTLTHAFVGVNCSLCFVCICVCSCVCIYIYMYIFQKRWDICAHAHACTCVYVCKGACPRTYAHMYIHTCPFTYNG